MVVVSNSTPLIYLACVAKFDLLNRFFGDILIPQEVYNEVVTQGKGRFGATEVSQATWIKTVAVTNTKKVSALLKQTKLERGEVEAICLALEKKADKIVLDEKRARNYANKQGLSVVGTVGILVAAKQKGIVKAIKPDLDKLRSENFWLGDDLYEIALKQVGEQP